MVDYNDIGVRIRFFRTQSNLSQEDLAELAKLSRVHISCIEEEKEFPVWKRLSILQTA